MNAELLERMKEGMAIFAELAVDPEAVAMAHAALPHLEAPLEVDAKTRRERMVSLHFVRALVSAHEAQRKPALTVVDDGN